MNGLQIYAIFQYGSGLIILCIILSVFSYIYYYVINKNYIQAKNSKITYRNFSNNVPLEDCNSIELKSNCKFFNEYDDDKNQHFAIPTIINNSQPPHVGNANFYYEDKNRENHISSVASPFLISTIICCILIIILISASINFYFITTNESYGAINGGIGLTSKIYSVFGRNQE